MTSGTDGPRPHTMLEQPTSSGRAPLARAPTLPAEERPVRLTGPIRGTGMSRSTGHRRIGAGRFTQAAPMDGNTAAWRESAVAAWPEGRR